MPGPAFRTAGPGETGGAIAPPDPWDPVVRLTHWSVALAVVVNHFVTRPGSAAHVWIGWGLMALLLLRLVWGFVGPHEARFSAFPPDPRATMSHLADLVRGRLRDYPSHNPAGAAMVYALWITLAAIVGSGLVMTGGRSPIAIAEEKAAVAAGDWSVLVDNAAEEGERDRTDARIAGELHDVAANLILVLALLHVAGVVIESRALGRNLVRPMIRGRSR
ncbi:cytochrome b/b6 domain-containing protein [Wenxinia saemankumensis]|uniref:Cytochrome b n=1 Tax=Wenxinia saemankumensis TaxID=1447782 RepID=A0A1M6E9C7_9RHOB|nr:cytochrome b/b6 domain-containing protein [Wenxinia saemankumensis]SHI82124.1 Cytochrome b [Wenxinia saemankumensis]